MQSFFFSLLLLTSVFIVPTLSIRAKALRSSIYASQTTGTLVGFWHNFENGSGTIKLKDVSDAWDVINVAFGEHASDYCTVVFTPYYDEASFKADIKTLQAKGKKVVLSLGGQNGVFLLPTTAARDTFVSSLKALISDYGFNGIDIDLENGIKIGAGDSDFKNPQSAQYVNLISAVKSIASSFSDFILSMAPEIAYVQGGYSAFAGAWGGYLPIIYGLRNELTYIHVQHYNAGGATGLDGNYYTQGTADFQVAMAEMLLKGFPIANNPNNMFPALPQSKVMIGLPANGPAAPSGGYISPTEMIKALNYLIKGTSFGGKYVLRTSSGYPGFRGLMTWSINWDAYNKFEFSTSYRAYFGGSVVVIPPVESNTLQSAALAVSAVTLSADKKSATYRLTATVPAKNTATIFTFIEGTSTLETGTLIAGSNQVIVTRDLTKTVSGLFTYSFKLSDASKSLISNTVSASVTIDSTVVNTLKAATLSVGTILNGAYSVTALVSSHNLASCIKITENGVVIATVFITQNSTTANSVEQKISGKSAGSYSYVATVYDSNCNYLDSQTLIVVVPSATPVSTLQVGVLSLASQNGGSFVLSAIVPKNNLATSYSFVEGSVQIGKGSLIAATSSDIIVTQSISNKVAGTYSYVFNVIDATGRSLSSNTISVNVQASGGATGNEWAEGKSFKTGDIVTYKGISYKCLQSHTAWVGTGYYPDVTPSLWAKVA